MSYTAASCFILPRPPISSAVAKEYRRLSADPKTIGFIDLVDAQASRKIRSDMVFHVIQILLETPQMKSYKYRDDPRLQLPAPTRRVPTGPDHKMKPHILKLTKIDQASLEGNQQWILEVMKQLDLVADVDAKKKLGEAGLIPIVGDELTCKSIRSLKRLKSDDNNGFDRMDWTFESIGWFHVQMCLANEIWRIHSGTVNGGTGLARDVSLLKRLHFKASKETQSTQTNKKSKGSTTTAETKDASSGTAEKPEKLLTSKQTATISHHDLEELIFHSLDARVLTAWLHVAQKNGLEELEGWQPCPDTLLAYAERLVEKFASIEALQSDDDSELIDKIPKPKKKKKNQPKYDSQVKAEPEVEPEVEIEPELSPLAASEKAQKIIFRNCVRFVRDALVYRHLRVAIRRCDVGRMEELMPTLTFMFKGGGHCKYAVQMLEVQQQMKYEHPEELK